jgi:predicted enzyme related to lactoylglutathione lyase
MPVVDHSAPGDFCWFELATSDQNAAKSFYTALFGWTVQDVPMGPGGLYSLLQLNGRIAASAYTMLPDESSAGLPPHWKLYVAVTSADDTVRKASELGARIIDPPFDIGDRGRTAVIQDPTGAVFFLWQPNQRSGVGVTGEPGSFCWADLTTPDQARAKSFYEGVFGWNVTPGRDNSGYLHIVNGQSYIGGIPPTRPGSSRTPPHWLVYFAVGSVDTTIEKAKELTARTLFPPTDFQGVGRMAILADPQGAVFALFQGTNK